MRVCVVPPAVPVSPPPPRQPPCRRPPIATSHAECVTEWLGDGLCDEGESRLVQRDKVSWHRPVGPWRLRSWAFACLSTLPTAPGAERLVERLFSVSARFEMCHRCLSQVIWRSEFGMSYRAAGNPCRVLVLRKPKSAKRRSGLPSTGRQVPKHKLTPFACFLSLPSANNSESCSWDLGDCCSCDCVFDSSSSSSCGYYGFECNDPESECFGERGQCLLA